MMYGPDIFRVKYKNRHHFPKEPLVALCSTDIVPKGSPLLVSTTGCCHVEKSHDHICHINRIIFTLLPTGSKHAEYF